MSSRAIAVNKDYNKGADLLTYRYPTNYFIIYLNLPVIIINTNCEPLEKPKGFRAEMGNSSDFSVTHLVSVSVYFNAVSGIFHKVHNSLVVRGFKNHTRVTILDGFQLVCIGLWS